MTRGRQRWLVRLSAAAEADFESILRWTADRFGHRQARTYARTLRSALAALASGPTIPGARPRDDIAPGLFTLHVARRGRRGRHFVLFRAWRVGDRDVVDVIRLLHDAMDLPQHVPPEAVEDDEPPS
jgi:toxin ParE1/3/4